MTCPQRNHHLLLIYCLFVLLHVQQTVNSLQNGGHNRHPAETHSRYGYSPLLHKYSRKGVGAGTDDLGSRELVVNGLREREREHHFRHQHNRQLHRQPQQDSSVSTLRNEGVHHPHSGSPAPHKSVHRFASRRIEEAVHAFQTSSTTERPVPVALHEHSVHHHQHHNQPLQNHHSHHHSTRQPHHRMHEQTSRPRQDDKMSSTWPRNHHQRSSVGSYDFTTGSSLILRMEPPPASQGSAKGDARGSESGTASHGNHVKRPDATDDDYDENYDDEENYYYEEDNDNEDENDDNDDNEDTENDDKHANEDIIGLKMDTAARYTDVVANGLGYVEATKNAAVGVLASDEDAIQDDLMDYDEHHFLADEPINGQGSLTEQKMLNYSTREGVKKMAAKEEPDIAAYQHLKRINQEALCRYPHPKFVPISNNTSKRFIPHFTILHRCGDDTGCCWSDSKTCVAHTTESVVLYFYVIPMGQTQPVAEPLPLINHTECHCVDRNPARTTAASYMFDVTPSRERSSSLCVKYFDLDESDPGYARCDCINRRPDRREACQRLSRGEEGFPVDDQRCIIQGRCIAPACEYGQYNKTMGRCPNKNHKIETAKHVNQPFH